MLPQLLSRLRNSAPLVHNITNYVVMNSTANALLALGASPVMAHAIEEVAEMTRLSAALVINLGTLSSPWIQAMQVAGQEAQRRRIPIILDPVGAGATHFRTQTALRLIGEIGPTIIRGNASEIGALVRDGATTKGVDSRHSPDEIAAEAAALSKAVGCVVSVSGPQDLIVAGDRAVRVANGHPLMTRVTGMGCAASAITGAFAAISESPLDAAVAAMTTVGIAGEIAAETASGPGSFQVQFLDALYRLTDTDLTGRAKQA